MTSRVSFRQALGMRRLRGLRGLTAIRLLTYLSYLLWTALILFSISLVTRHGSHGNPDSNHDTLPSRAQVYAVNYRLRPIQVDLNFEVPDPRDLDHDLNPGGAEEPQHPPNRKRSGLREEILRKKQEGFDRRIQEVEGAGGVAREGQGQNIKVNKVKPKVKDRHAFLVDVNGNKVDAETVERFGGRRSAFRYDVIPTRISRDEQKPKYLLKLFTLMPDDARRAPMYGNVLRVWSDFGKAVLPVLYTNNPDGGWERRARLSGYDVRKIPKTRHDLPVLKDMILDVMTGGDAMFFGFANADILFDKSLATTLAHLATSYQTASKKLVLTGKLVDVPIEKIGGLTSFDQVAGLKDFGSDAASDAIDYVIFAPDSVPWGEVPDLVLGAPGVGTWLVARAREWGLTVVDGTDTVTSIRQGTLSRQPPPPDICINWSLAVPFDPLPGSIDCAPYLTRVDLAGGIVLVPRGPVPSSCTPDPLRAKSQNSCHSHLL